MDDMDLLRSPTAIVARREIAGDYGSATVHCVVLADGFIIECGCDGYSKKRAALLAQAVNAFGSDNFTR